MSQITTTIVMTLMIIVVIYGIYKVVKYFKRKY